MVYTLGESLLDIIISSIDNVTVRPGGAMLNAAISLGRSNIDVSLITELGDDESSSMITSFLKTNNINTDSVHLYNNNSTSLALAFLDENKKPKYTFFKNYPNQRDISNIPKFNKDDILLFGSLYSLDKKIRKSILTIANKAKQSGATIIYDPNIRNAHHLNDKELLNAVYHNIKTSDIVKGSDEDFSNIFNTINTHNQIAELRKINKNALLIITLGADGVIADINGQTVKLPALKTKVTSTIGAGDAFNAGIIYELKKMNYHRSDILNISTNSVKNLLKSGLKFSAEVCSSYNNYISTKSFS